MPKQRKSKDFVGDRQQRLRNVMATQETPSSSGSKDVASFSVTEVDGRHENPIHTVPNSAVNTPLVITVSEISNDHGCVDDDDSSVDSYGVPSEKNDEQSELDWSWDEQKELVGDENVEEQLLLKKDLGNWAVVCDIPRSHLNKLLLLLRKFKTLSFLPKDYPSLLKSVRTVFVKTVAPGEYFHFGLANGVVRTLHQSSPRIIPKIVSVTVNIDGIPLTKGSNSQFWPVLGKVNWEVCSINAKPFVFVIGIYHGDAKPDNLDDYLQDFVSESIELANNGLFFRDTKVLVKIGAFVCDAPARSYICCVKGQTAYFGCHKCITKGEYYRPNVNKRNGRVTYPETSSALRTDVSFRNRVFSEHHTGFSILEKLELDMVSDIPLDTLHLTDLGVTRKLWNSWMNGKYERVKLSRDKQVELSRRIDDCIPYIPDDFHRKLAPLKLYERWKGTCYRMIKLYLGPVVLLGVLPENLYKHFVSFHVATKLLSNEQQCIKPEILDYFQKLFINFVQDSAILYGQQFISYNVHNLIHIANDVKKFGPLDSFSAYPFENHLQILKNLVRHSGKPLQQVVKRIGEIEINRFLSDEEQVSSLEDLGLKNEHDSGPTLPNLNGLQFHKLKLRRWNLQDNKPNNCVFANDGNVVMIENFILRNSVVYLIGR